MKMKFEHIINESRINTKISRAAADVLFQRHSWVTYSDKIAALADIGFECFDDSYGPISEVLIDKGYSIRLDATKSGLVKASLLMADGEVAEYDTCDSAKSLEDFLKMCLRVVDRYGV